MDVIILVLEAESIAGVVMIDDDARQDRPSV